MSKWEQWKKNLGESRPWHILDPSRQIKDSSIIKNRLDICNNCEHFLRTYQCSKCGCFMPVKVKLANAECPVGKWQKEEDDV